MKSTLICVALLSAIAVPASAAPRTAALSIPNMDCPVCPITVRKALSKVDGVIQVDVSLERREAVVVFDDARTTVEELMRATAAAGYPSTARR